MTRFTTGCPACGEHIVMPITDATLHVPTTGPMRCCYRCPECDEDVAQTVSVALGNSLAARGMPAERVETAVPSQHIPGPAIDWDDLIEFGLRLEAATDVV